MNHTFSFAKFATIILICMTVLSTGIFMYVQTLNSTLEKETISYLKEFAQQDARHIEMQVSEDLEVLKSIALAINVFEPTDEKIIELLHEESQQHLFKNLEFVWPDGTAHLDNNSFLILADEPHFQKALKGLPNISTRLKDFLDNASILVEAVPVFRNDQIFGVLMGTRRTEDFARTLDMESFSGDGYSLLVEADGDKVIESFHKNAISGLYNIFDMPADPDHELRELVMQDFREGKSGFVKYQSKTRGLLYISYQPLHINDWFLISVVPAQHLNALTRHFVTLLLVLCILIAVSGMIIGGYVHSSWEFLQEEK